MGRGLGGCTHRPPTWVEDTARFPLLWLPAGLCPRHVGLPWKFPKGPGTAESALSHKEHSTLNSVQSHTSTTAATWLLRNLALAWWCVLGDFSAAAPRAGLCARAPRAWRMAARSPWALERPPQTSPHAFIGPSHWLSKAKEVLEAGPARCWAGDQSRSSCSAAGSERLGGSPCSSLASFFPT